MPRHVYLSIRANAQACLSQYTRECPGMSISVHARMPRHVHLSIRVNAQACLSQYTRECPGMSISVHARMPRHVYLSIRVNAQACLSQYTRECPGMSISVHANCFGSESESRTAKGENEQQLRNRVKMERDPGNRQEFRRRESCESVDVDKRRRFEFNRRGRRSPHCTDNRRQAYGANNGLRNRSNNFCSQNDSLGL